MTKIKKNFKLKKFTNIINILSRLKNANKQYPSRIHNEGIEEANKLKKIIIKKNYKVIKLNGSNEKLSKKIILLANLLGKSVSQNINDEKYVVIEPNLKLLKKYKNISNNKIRYHQTNKGGSIHTDGPQLNNSPNILIMGCIKNATKGGKTILVDSKKLFNKIKNHDQISAEVLKKKFLFERRGFGGNKKILSKKIFDINNKKFEFRYLREYINSAYKIKKLKIPNNKKKALDLLDVFLEKKELQTKLKLNVGDVILINNKSVAHGRTSFTLSKNKPRKLLRIWVN
jgi:alpha-ketoglutarate-dependent taurine dioxygenase